MYLINYCALHSHYPYMKSAQVDNFHVQKYAYVNKTLCNCEWKLWNCAVSGYYGNTLPGVDMLRMNESFS
jgi:hypothetical protein